MRALVLHKMQLFRTKITPDWILHITEKFFYIIPCLFLGYLFFVSLETKLGILSPVQHNPIYTVYFITFLCFFFCGFLTRQIRVLKEEDKSFAKLAAIVLLVSQLFMLNMIGAALIVWFIKNEFSWDVRHIHFRQLKWRWQLLICVYVGIIAFVIFIIRQLLL